MTDGLGDALSHTHRQIAEGLIEAEQELAEARERCRVLEREIRSTRAALERMEAQEAGSPWIVEPAAMTVPALEALVAAVPVAEPEIAEPMVEEQMIAEAVPGPVAAAAVVDVMPPTPPLPPAMQPAPVVLPDVPERVEVREAELAVSVPLAAPESGVEAPANGDRVAGDDDEGPTEFAEYMPMLEELWAIARNEDDPADTA